MNEKSDAWTVGQPAWAHERANEPGSSATGIPFCSYVMQSPIGPIVCTYKPLTGITTAYVMRSDPNLPILGLTIASDKSIVHRKGAGDSRMPVLLQILDHLPTADYLEEGTRKS